LLLEDRFPRIWVPSSSLEERDVRQLLVHRHKQVVARTQVKNQLQAMALGQGVQKKWKLWTAAGRVELEKLELLPYAAERRAHLLHWLDQLEAAIAELNRQVEAEVKQRPDALRLMTHAGVGPMTALAMVLTLGPAERFASPKQVASYFGLIPSEHSSGGRQQSGAHQQAGQFVSAFPAGGSRTVGGALRHGTGTFLSPAGGAQASRAGQSGGGAQAGDAVVPDVARGLGLCATMQGGCAGEPESFCGRKLRSTA
jgi:hypothetical protein